MNCFLLPIFVASFFMIGTAYGIPLTPEDTELNSELISYYFFLRSVNFEMSFWCHRFDQNTNENCLRK